MSVVSHALPARPGEAEAPGSAFIDQAGHLVELNAALSALLGSPHDQLAGHALTEAWAPVLTPIIQQVVVAAAAVLNVALPAHAAGTAPLEPLVASCSPAQTRCGYVANVSLVVHRQDSRAPAPGCAEDRQEGLASTTLPDRSPQELRAQLREQAYELMLVRELPGPIIAWNRGAEELYGFTRAAAIGLVSHALLRTVYPAAIPTVRGHAADGGPVTGRAPAHDL
ncbi:MAG: hypothetical protein HGA45_28130 [Chloroflexales bacterium]|nr:hypothetical protein [Chloroflexales bacterium]